MIPKPNILDGADRCKVRTPCPSKGYRWKRQGDVAGDDRGWGVKRSGNAEKGRGDKGGNNGGQDGWQEDSKEYDVQRATHTIAKSLELKRAGDRPVSHWCFFLFGQFFQVKICCFSVSLYDKLSYWEKGIFIIFVLTSYDWLKQKWIENKTYYRFRYKIYITNMRHCGYTASWFSQIKTCFCQIQVSVIFVFFVISEPVRTVCNHFMFPGNQQHQPWCQRIKQEKVDKKDKQKLLTKERLSGKNTTAMIGWNHQTQGQTGGEWGRGAVVWRWCTMTEREAERISALSLNELSWEEIRLWLFIWSICAG